MSTHRISVGIDLGTTNSALAFSEGEDVHPFAVEQVVQPGEVRSEELLPSFTYLPGPKDFAEGATALPWDPAPRLLVGALARRRGAENAGRLVSSAKSWLSYSGVDRTDAFLPVQAPEGVSKISPLSASRAYLQHLNAAWKHAGNAPLAEYDVVLTVPASFDAVARQLTEKAAREAGLKNIVLLEEPQAAFYAWLAKHPEWREITGPGDRILIIDIGGGTTDFTLIDVKDEGGNLTLERVAVGDHILLGGDNMDLALARHVEASLVARNVKLDTQQLQALWQQCRAAKEALLEPGATATEHPVTILGRGSSLIGGTIKTMLTRAEVEQILVDGFLPPCSLNEEPQRARRAALQELALPYASDARVTAHLAHFLHQAGALPTHVLFNGGVLRAGLVRERILRTLNSWLPKPVRVLDGEDLMLAVARGAAYYGLARQGKGIRIRGGVGRTYYVGIEDAMPAVPGVPAPMKVLTVVPFGMEEGSAHRFPNRKFGLYVGEPVEFRIFSSTERQNDNAGLLLDPMPEGLTELPAMELTLEPTATTARGLVPVTLESVVTETGVLELYCVAANGDRWKLEFNVRERKA
ncbi:Hsp70 family protein [Bryobacter aggregatus]|uniref:Hsp70 family protein n=1 Tax=Bryobacter aggregatus TaxID=360054 RepID=UPI0004E1B7FA|nr:Hsp70 family protein [Bryobacter aggregatus]